MLLIDFDAVKMFSLARGCVAERRSSLACEMTCAAGAAAMCTATDKDGTRWNVLDVFRACRDARVGADGPQRPGKATPPAGLNTEQYEGREHGLREELIAEALTADGIWPYLSKRRSNALDALLASEAREGFIPTADSNPKVKLAARCVIDAGLADHIIGPRRGILVCIKWTPAARRSYLTPVEVDALATLAEKPAR